MEIINGFVDVCNAVGGFLWGPWTQIFLIVVGIYLTVGTVFWMWVFAFFGLVKDYEGEQIYRTAVTDKTHRYIQTHPAYIAQVRTELAEDTL